jgi:hypothetical protein
MIFNTKNSVKKLEKKYVIHGYKLGNGKWDTIFGLDLIGKSNFSDPIIKEVTFSLERGILLSIREDRLLTSFNGFPKDDKKIIMDFYIKNGGNPDHIHIA